MRTTINIADDILLRAQQLSQVKEKTKLVNMALEALIEKCASMRLAKLEGTERKLQTAPRRR